MSFFDETDDEPRRAPRTQQRRPRPSGRGGPPGDQQQIQTRRTVAVVGVVVAVVLMALLIHSCQVSQRNNALKDYNTSVSSLIQRSQETSGAVFGALKGVNSTTAPSVANSLANALAGARRQLSDAEALSVPSQMDAAQSNVVLALKMRVDGINVIASEIEPAVGKTDSADAVNAIAGAMARFYASDVVYKAYAAPAIAGALNNARIPVGQTGQEINADQFLPDLGWLQTSFIDTEIGAQAPSSGQKNTDQPGLHGHSLNSVSVGAVTLTASGTNTLPASSATTFQLNVTNGGDFNEFGVGCSVSISGLNDSGTGSLSETTPGQVTDCSVTLPHPPTPGTYTVTAKIAGVPGETNLANNVLTFPVTFT